MDRPMLHKRINEVFRGENKTLYFAGFIGSSGLNKLGFHIWLHVDTVVICGNKWEKETILRKIL